MEGTAGKQTKGILEHCRLIEMQITAQRVVVDLLTSNEHSEAIKREGGFAKHQAVPRLEMVARHLYKLGTSIITTSHKTVSAPKQCRTHSTMVLRYSVCSRSLFLCRRVAWLMGGIILHCRVAPAATEAGGKETEAEKRSVPLQNCIPRWL